MKNEKEKQTDFATLGFKSGLEIHQQLEGKKLFCNCPTEIRKGNHDFEITRKLRASAGEEGKTDAAALHEQKKNKTFMYLGYNDINCGVELDEEPPLPVNQDALRAALQVAKILNCKICDKIQVMRKTVVDGSNVSGFQRTMLVGTDGFIEIEGKKIRIASLCLEEEACQVVERKKDQDTYNLSRLGIPLLEIATEADISTPDEAKEAASNIGMILRSIKECKRGIGSIRQDVNISIKGGERIEIKGFQDLKSIPKVINYEIERQQKLIKKGEEVKSEVRKAEDDFTTSFLRPMPGASRMYPETDIPEIIPSIQNIEEVETLAQKTESLVKDHGLSKEIASQVVKQSIDLKTLTKKYVNIEPKFIAETLITIPKEIKTRFGKEINALEHSHAIFEQLNHGKIPKGAVFEILSEIAHGRKVDFGKYSLISLKELEKDIINLIKEKKDASIQALMGLVMQKHRGKIDGKTAMELIQKHKK